NFAISKAAKRPLLGGLRRRDPPMSACNPQHGLRRAEIQYPVRRHLLCYGIHQLRLGRLIEIDQHIVDRTPRRIAQAAATRLRRAGLSARTGALPEFVAAPLAQRRTGAMMSAASDRPKSQSLWRLPNSNSWH